MLAMLLGRLGQALELNVDDTGKFMLVDACHTPNKVLNHIQIM